MFANGYEQCQKVTRGWYTIHQGYPAALYNQVADGRGTLNDAGMAFMGVAGDEEPRYMDTRRGTSFWFSNGYTLAFTLAGSGQIEHCFRMDKEDKAHAETVKWHTWQAAND